MHTLRNSVALAALTLSFAPALAQTAAPKPAAPAVAPAAAPAAPTAAPAAPAPATRNEAGKVELVNGAVTVTGPDRSRRIPKPGDMLYEGDAVSTGVDGELQAEMMDSGVIAVRPNTEMSITKYQAEGTATDTSVFGLIKGSFRSITGWIGKNNPTRYRINTPTATVGVRGTDHEPLVIPEGSSLGEAGTYDKVAAGGSYISGKSGRVDVAPGKTGFFSHAGRERPRVLAANPTFYRPSRNEARLEGRHDRVRQTMEQRRTERMQMVRERRAQRAQQGGGNPAAQQRREANEARRQAQAQQHTTPQALHERQQAQAQQRQQAQAQAQQRQQAQVQQRQAANQQNAEERRKKAEELRREREQQRSQRREQR